MVKVGYFLASEEFGPNELIEQAKMAEAAGFEALWISDHFHPWNSEQGNSPFVWSVIGGLSQATSLTVTTGVTCPTMRIHPAIIAQAAATSAVMLGGRFSLGIGTGENLNEHIFGDRWPPADVGLEMLEEAVEVMHLLWEGGVKDHHGKHYTVENAQLYTLPEEPPPVLISGFGPKAIRLAGRIGDGYCGVVPDPDVVGLFRSSGGVLDDVRGAVRRAREPGGDRDAAALDVPGDLPAPLFESVHARAQPLSSLATSRRHRLHRHEGAISLAAALAIPLTVQNGASFPGRDQILFLTFCVILITLVVQGMSLPLLIRRLGLAEAEGEVEHEETEARLRAAEAALTRLDELADEGRGREDTTTRMRDLYEYRRRRFAARHSEQIESGEEGDSYEERSLVHQRFRRELLGAERAELLRLRSEGHISDEVRRRVERDLDLEDARLEI